MEEREGWSADWLIGWICCLMISVLEEEQKAWDEQYGQSNSSSSGGMDIEQQEEVDDDEEEESLLDLDNVYQPLPSHEDLEQELIERQKEELKNMLKQSAMTLN
eukprot:TRINITY_DN1875_c0_g1_i3.p4 TRINITY_DN1875_c0_g1~~TRINITY_DN1875_c0_g1_i3.p4  ORF type:complete len:104 (-),score=48.60 TRINITY_DN1875_c0_g1_i3:19-330(-)